MINEGEMALLEQKAAKWLKMQKYDRKTWKDLAPILASFSYKEAENFAEEKQKLRSDLKDLRRMVKANKKQSKIKDKLSQIIDYLKT